MPSDSDVPPVRHASRYLYRRLLTAGVRIFEWRESMMHAKMGIIDGEKMFAAPVNQVVVGTKTPEQAVLEAHAAMQKVFTS